MFDKTTTTKKKTAQAFCRLLPRLTNLLYAVLWLLWIYNITAKQLPHCDITPTTLRLFFFFFFIQVRFKMVFRSNYYLIFFWPKHSFGCIFSVHNFFETVVVKSRCCYVRKPIAIQWFHNIFFQLVTCYYELVFYFLVQFN